MALLQFPSQPACQPSVLAMLRFLVSLLIISACVSLQAETVTEAIDRHISARWAKQQITPTDTVDDASFARRIHLSLIGRPPFVSELDTFLADGRTDKREHLVQHLLSSEAYAGHMAQLFDSVLMGRRGAGEYKKRKDQGWLTYLQRQFKENVSWETTAQEILLARPTTASRKGSTWFLFERKDEHQVIAEAIAPAFFGIRIECAQCHDHPLVDEIKQAHYWGLTAFFNRGKNQNTKQGPQIQESAIGGFSDFSDLIGNTQPNELVFFKADKVDEARPKKDDKPEDKAELYRDSEIEGLPRVPLFSRRAAFVDQVLTGHPLLATAMVNKLWAIMLGRGLVDPVDEIDSLHPPSHPQLLEYLSQQFRDSNYDVKALIKAIALSTPYQLSSNQPAEIYDPATFAWFQPQPLTAEVMVQSLNSVVRHVPNNELGVLNQFRRHFPEVLQSKTNTGLDDAMFLSNNAEFNQFLTESNGPEHLVPSMLKLDSNEKRISLLFRSAFSRLPDADELTEINSYLNQRQDDLTGALHQVVWAVVTSAEFRFNH